MTPFLPKLRVMYFPNRDEFEFRRVAEFPNDSSKGVDERIFSIRELVEEVGEHDELDKFEGH